MGSICKVMMPQSEEPDPLEAVAPLLQSAFLASEWRSRSIINHHLPPTPSAWHLMSMVTWYPCFHRASMRWECQPYLTRRQAIEDGGVVAFVLPVKRREGALGSTTIKAYSIKLSSQPIDVAENLNDHRLPFTPCRWVLTYALRGVTCTAKPNAASMAQRNDHIKRRTRLLFVLFMGWKETFIPKKINSKNPKTMSIK